MELLSASAVIELLATTCASPPLPRRPVNLAQHRAAPCRAHTGSSRAVPASEPFMSDGVTQYMCAHAGCRKVFRRQCEYRKHYRNHQPERPFACTQCSKSFKHSSGLRKHEKSMHSTTRFCCPVANCRKFIKRKDNWRVHIKKAHPEVSDLEVRIAETTAETTLSQHAHQHHQHGHAGHGHATHHTTFQDVELPQFEHDLEQEPYSEAHSTPPLCTTSSASSISSMSSMSSTASDASLILHYSGAESDYDSSAAASPAALVPDHIEPLPELGIFSHHSLVQKSHEHPTSSCVGGVDVATLATVLAHAAELLPTQGAKAEPAFFVWPPAESLRGSNGSMPTHAHTHTVPDILHDVVC